MQLVTRATSNAAVAVVLSSMLMQIATAVEVTGDPAVESASISGLTDQVGEALPEPSPNCFILGSRSFSIPFSVDSAGAQPVEVHLFVSRGSHDQWRLLDRKKPDVSQRQFQFEADGDGEFWFATRTIDALGRTHPAGEIESQLKVYVDTTKPQVTFQADADFDGRVDVKLAIHDATKLKDLRLRYITDQSKLWVNVDLEKLASDGRLQFMPTEPWKQLSIQLVVTDTPGNQSVVNQLLRRPRLADADTSQFAAAPTKDSTDAMALPYRIGPNDQLPAHTVSNPVIKLDRNQPRPVSNVTTALGYAPESSSQGNTPFYGLRGGESPLPQSPGPQSPGPQSPGPQSTGPQSTGMTYVPPTALAPAPTMQSALPTQATSPSRFAPAVGAISNQDAPPQQGMVPQQGRLPQQGMVPQYAMAPQRGVSPSHVEVPPQSLLERLFGSSPPPAYPTQSFPAPMSGPSATGFGPPSVRGSQVQSRFAGSVAGTTEGQSQAPATETFSGNSFGLNSPGQSQPETIPVPSNPEPSPPPQRARPRTPAEAMRSINEPSEVSVLTQEEIPAPQGEPDAYRSMRATPGPSASPPSRTDIAEMMQRAPVRYSDSERFSLAYELEAVGVQGVDAIELYGSTDGGRTWDLWGSDPDRTSPFDIETMDAGVFGFRIVVVGRNGLASPRPMSGETPDIVVVVDTTQPVVRITGAQYGEGDRIGSLIIRYQCEDTNLKQRPISLSFSDRVDGPWTTIAAGLRNEGEYIWNADPNLPRQLFLRIDATDEAGNTGAYVLDQPIDAQGLAPRARIRGFQSISGAEIPESEGQTAKHPRALFK